MINFLKKIFKLPKNSVLDTTPQLSVDFLIAKRDVLKIKSDFLFDWWDVNREKRQNILIVWQKHFELEQKVKKLNKAINELTV